MQESEWILLFIVLGLIALIYATTHVNSTSADTSNSQDTLADKDSDSNTQKQHNFSFPDFEQDLFNDEPDIDPNDVLESGWLFILNGRRVELLGLISKKERIQLPQSTTNEKFYYVRCGNCSEYMFFEDYHDRLTNKWKCHNCHREVHEAVVQYVFYASHPSIQFDDLPPVNRSEDMFVFDGVPSRCQKCGGDWPYCVQDCDDDDYWHDDFWP